MLSEELECVNDLRILLMDICRSRGFRMYPLQEAVFLVVEHSELYSCLVVKEKELVLR